MSRDTLTLNHRVLNGWPLFWLLALPLSATMAMEASNLDLSRPASVSHMIQYSVRWAVPFIFLVTAASAMPVLFPNDLTRWLLRNRRYIGLVFAVAMAWQGAFIFIVSNLHADYYYDEIYYLRDELEGSSGYLFLTAMVFTSFRFGRQRLTAAQWKTLHRCGVYFLWAYAFSVYWWNLFYYGNAVPVDYVFYAMGFLAFAARIAAWGKRRQLLDATQDHTLHAACRVSGAAIVALGCLAAATGHLWQGGVSAILTAPRWSSTLELWLPFWPFEPFLPLAAVGVGTFLYSGGFALTRSDERTSVGAGAPP